MQTSKCVVVPRTRPLRPPVYCTASASPIRRPPCGWRQAASAGASDGGAPFPYSIWYPHLFATPTVQQLVSIQTSYRLWQTGCSPQTDRACEQVARCWAGRGGTLPFRPTELFALCSFTLHSIRCVKFCAISATRAVSSAGDRAVVWKSILCLARNCVRAFNEIAKFTF